MKKSRLFITFLIVAGMMLSLSVCSFGQDLSGDGSAEAAASSSDAVRYENGDAVLLVPAEYDDLLIVQIPSDDSQGVLFSVSEKASVEAAAKGTLPDGGAGWLFEIRKIDEAARQELLCYTDLSGSEIFAKDADGCWYVFGHPTDVRFVRESTEQMAADQAQWTELNEWAWTSVRSTFLDENAGLASETADSSDVYLYLARIAYLPGMRYTVSTTEYGPIEPAAGVFDAAPYTEKLMKNVSFEACDLSQIPDGEYVVLNLPDDDVRFDFFLAEGAENFVREVHGEEDFALYKASYPDDTNAASVMQDWYDALVADRDMSALGYTPDSFIGTWTEKADGQDTVAVSALAGGLYEVQICRSGESGTQIWRMTARPAASNILRYTDGCLASAAADGYGTGTEEVLYTDGCGEFLLTSTNELLWTDLTGHAGDDLVFISAD